MDIEQQLEEPGRDEKVDKAWDGMITAACESLDALFELSFEWNSKDPLQIAEPCGHARVVLSVAYSVRHFPVCYRYFDCFDSFSGWYGMVAFTSGIWLFDFCAAFDCLITILPHPSRAPYIARMMTHIWAQAIIAPFRGSWGILGSVDVCLGKLSGPSSIFLESACRPLSRAPARVWNVGQAQAPAVARTPARHFCATRPCTLCFLGHVP